jgi:DNA primase
MLPEYSSNVLDCFVRQYPNEWLSDGISAETMDKFNISYSISQNKIIIPHYDVDGRLVGIRGRALNEWEIENIGKYTPIRVEQTWYKHPLSMNLYGLNITKDNIRKRGVCFLVESEKAVMQMESFSFPNCAAAVCGSNFNKYQLNILIKTCCPTEIVLCFDKEELPGEEKYFNKLYDICRKYGQYAQFSFIYDREGVLDLKESPTDRGEEVFKKLLEKRVKVQ